LYERSQRIPPHETKGPKLEMQQSVCEPFTMRQIRWARWEPPGILSAKLPALRICGEGEMSDVIALSLYAYGAGVLSGIAAVVCLTFLYINK